jgi:hypothetical protein
VQGCGNENDEPCGKGQVTRPAIPHGSATLELRGQAASASAGLMKVRELPEGILAVWSANDDPAFSRRLNASGFGATPIRVRARSNGNGATHDLVGDEQVIRMSAFDPKQTLAS